VQCITSVEKCIIVVQLVNNMEKIELTKYLRKLGLTQEASTIYLDLMEHAESTPLLIARRTGINRTKVYRVIEELLHQKLVRQEVGFKSSSVSPAPLTTLAARLTEKQRRVAELTQGWREVERELTQLGEVEKAETKVRYYRGKSGIEQMVWNVLSAKSEVVGYTTRDLVDFVGAKFMREFVAEFVRRNLAMRDIYGDEYQTNKHTQYDWGGRVKSRYVPSKILTIPHQMDIYDETVSFYRWVGEEVFGVEIVSPAVAVMQKQLFELAWERGSE